MLLLPDRVGNSLPALNGRMMLVALVYLVVQLVARPYKQLSTAFAAVSTSVALPRESLGALKASSDGAAADSVTIMLSGTLRGFRAHSSGAAPQCSNPSGWDASADLVV